MMNNDDFIEFIHSFDDEFLMPASEISRSHSGNRDELVKNKIPMYSLDDICKDSSELFKNLPKTTDAIYYKLNGDKLTLFIIEFKFFNMDGDYSNYQLLEAIHKQLKKKNAPRDIYSEKCISDKLLENFENVKEDFVDSVEVSLRLKPYETLMVALPVLYEEYCAKNGASSEFRQFLENVDIKFFVFVHKVNRVRNISAQRHFPHSIHNALKHQYLRLKLANIISYWDIIEASGFDEFINKEKLN